MPKSSYITARVEPALKESAETILNQVGVSTSEAITMFLHQVVLRRGLPFAVRIPNKQTRAAMAELEAGGGESFEGSNAELFAHLGRPKEA